MQSQQLDRRIRIEKPTITKGGSGGIVKQWDLVVTVFAQKRAMSGNERGATVQAGGKAAVARDEFLIRARDGIDETMRVVSKGKFHNIQHVKPLADYPGWMVLTCDTGLNDG